VNNGSGLFCGRLALSLRVCLTDAMHIAHTLWNGSTQGPLREGSSPVSRFEPVSVKPIKLHTGLRAKSTKMTGSVNSYYTSSLVYRQFY